MAIVTSGRAMTTTVVALVCFMCVASLAYSTPPKRANGPTREELEYMGAQHPLDEVANEISAFATSHHEPGLGRPHY